MRITSSPGRRKSERGKFEGSPNVAGLDVAIVKMCRLEWNPARAATILRSVFAAKLGMALYRQHLGHVYALTSGPSALICTKGTRMPFDGSHMVSRAKKLATKSATPVTLLHSWQAANSIPLGLLLEINIASGGI
jgi:hypothetical protein